MSTTKKNTFARLKRVLNYIRSDFSILILDIIAINFAYYFSLFLRFFANNGFQGSGETYIRIYSQMAPFYTIVCLLVFAFFRLYGGSWRYAGLNDLNRVTVANLVTIVILIAGSILYMNLDPEVKTFATRMPLPFYFVGALLQYILTTLIRFSKRLLTIEKSKISSLKAESIPSLIVGSGDLARKVYNHLESNTPYRIVAMAAKDSGRMMDGIPILSLNEIENQIQENRIKAIFIADKDLDLEQREQIRTAAQGIEIEDFTGYMSNQQGFLPLTNLLDVTDMPVTVVVDGKSRTFSSAEECLATLPGEYDVLHVQATKLILRKREEDKSWMDEYRNQTGQDVSFF